MSEAGGIGGASGPSELGPGQKIDFSQKDAKGASSSQKSSGAEQTKKENKRAYSKPAKSATEIKGSEKGAQEISEQKQITEQKQAKESKSQKQLPSGLNKDYEITKNPKLAAQLETRDAKKSIQRRKRGSGETKKSPPQMSLKTRLSPKGAINPKRPQTIIPDRLKGTSDLNSMNQLEEAVFQLESGAANEDPNLIAQYTKKLLSGEAGSGKQILANILGVDESLIDSDIDTIHKVLSEKLNSLDLSDELKTLLTNILANLEQPEISPLKSFIQLFMPFPFALEILDVDDQFWEDDEELLDEEFIDDEDDASSDGEDEDEEEVEEYDVEASMTITTNNFGKLHMHITQDIIGDKFKLSVKGDESATDLCLAMESNLELALGDSDFMQDQLRLWHDNVLRITESRTLQIHSDGKLNSDFMKACNSVVKTICDNDEEIPMDTIDADYNVL